MKKNLRNVLLYIVVPIIFIATIIIVSLSTGKVETTKYYEIVDMIKSNEVSEYKLNLYSGELVYTKRADNKEYRYTVADPGIFLNDVNEYVVTHNETAEKKDVIKYDIERGGENSWILSILPTVLLVGV